MIEDNIFFIDTPPDIQDEIFYEVLNHLENCDYKDKNIYLKPATALNIPDKYYFNVYIAKSFDPNAIPDFLIFLS
jgi:hypothetical protein